MAGLTGEGTSGFGALVGEIGVTLRHRVHIGDGTVDLLKADRLLTGGADDPDGPVGDDRDRRGDLVQGTPGGSHEVHPAGHLTTTFLKQALDVARRFDGAARQHADLRRDHGEALGSSPARAASTAAFKASRFV